jgi:hypothetical protein
MRRALLVLALATSTLAACQSADVRSVVYYNFSQMVESPNAQHYQQFADVNGGVVSLGCFVVQKRQLDCFDTTSSGQPNLRLGVVECECPCAAFEDDPCDASRRQVRTGTIRGLVNETQGPLQLGGVEIPSNLVLDQADDLFITVESNTDADPSPSDSVLLKGVLTQDGTVLRGNLKSPTTQPVTGSVSILPVEDEVSL